MVFIMIAAGAQPVLAGTGTHYTDKSTWQSHVSSIEKHISSSSNVVLSNEVASAPGDETDLGFLLTYDQVNTGLSRSFQIITGSFAEGATFIYNEKYMGSVHPDFADALSVGLGDSHEDDDWGLFLNDGSTMSAFGVNLRNNRAEAGETMSLYSGSNLMATLDMSSIGSPGNTNDFVGVTTDFLFDRVVYNEDPGSDDIAVADFKFAAVAPEPSSIMLFASGLSTLGIFGWRRKRQKV